MKKIAIILTTIVISFNAFAEDGADRLAERNMKIVEASK